MNNFPDSSTEISGCKQKIRQNIIFKETGFKTQKKPPGREVFFIGSDCRIRTNDQSVNSRLLYR